MHHGCTLRRVTDVSLPVEQGALHYEEARAAEIDVSWAAACAANPTLFDGRVHFLRDVRIEAGVLRGTARSARYATLLHWRDQGFPDIGSQHVFGAAVLRAADGAFLLGRMAAHTTNAGWVYFPGGAMDEDDVLDGVLDPAGNICREFAEETGLDLGVARFDEGFVIISGRESIAITREVHLPWDAEESRARLISAIEGQSDQELSDILIVRDARDADDLHLKPYARAILSAALPTP